MASTTSDSEPSEPALTTIFTPPSTCLQRTYSMSPTGLDRTGAPGDGVLSLWKGYTLDCFPTEAVLSDGWVYLSPGICPSAYSIASIWTEWPNTWATCCPWYMHVSESHYDCGSWPQTTSAEIIESGSTITTSGYAWDTPIVIAWQSEDLSLFPHHPTETGSWNVAKGITSPPAVSTTPPITVTDNGMFISAGPAAEESSSDGSNASEGLSTGAQAGIGVGVSIAVLLAALGVFLFWRRRRRTSKNPGDDNVPPELPDTSRKPAQLGGDGIHEKSGSGGVHEAVGHTLSHEMTGDGSFLPAELESDTNAELQGDNKEAIRAELQGDEIEIVKPPPEYESERDYSRDLAKIEGEVKDADADAEQKKS